MNVCNEIAAEVSGGKPGAAMPHADTAALDLICASSTVGELPGYSIKVVASAPVAELVAQFANTPRLPGVLIMEADRPTAVLSRARFVERLAFGKPVHTVAAVIGPDSRIETVPETMSVVAAADRALAREGAGVHEPMAVERADGVIALVDLHLLLRAHLRVLQLNNREQRLLIEEVSGYTAGLEREVSTLRRSQEGLFQARKLAALGQLVAGVAHEINTPVGVGLTAVTHLQERTAEFQHAFKGGALRRTDVYRFLGTATESCDLIYSNLKRAADLVKSFRQVAVDQASEKRRTFNLKEYLHEVLWSLQPRLKETRHRIEIACPGDIVLDSYPGAVWQVISNLVVNTLNHAFGNGAGCINLEAVAHGEAVTLRYSNDGRGISPENLQRIFEPFYSTRHDRGGAGLGLHIVFNLVTHTLGGSIECHNLNPTGVQFTLEIPRVAPHREQASESSSGHNEKE